MYAALSYFQDFNDQVNMKSEKTILRIFSGISP